MTGRQGGVLVDVVLVKSLLVEVLLVEVLLVEVLLVEVLLVEVLPMEVLPMEVLLMEGGGGRDGGPVVRISRLIIFRTIDPSRSSSIRQPSNCKALPSLPSLCEPVRPTTIELHSLPSHRSLCKSSRRQSLAPPPLKAPRLQVSAVPSIDLPSHFAIPFTNLIMTTIILYAAIFFGIAMMGSEPARQTGVAILASFGQGVMDIASELLLGVPGRTTLGDEATAHLDGYLIQLICGAGLLSYLLWSRLQLHLTTFKLLTSLGLFFVINSLVSGGIEYSGEWNVGGLTTWQSWVTPLHPIWWIVECMVFLIALIEALSSPLTVLLQRGLLAYAIYYFIFPRLVAFFRPRTEVDTEEKCRRLSDEVAAIKTQRSKDAATQATALDHQTEEVRKLRRFEADYVATITNLRQGNRNKDEELGITRHSLIEEQRRAVEYVGKYRNLLNVNTDLHRALDLETANGNAREATIKTLSHRVQVLENGGKEPAGADELKLTVATLRRQLLEAKASKPSESAAPVQPALPVQPTASSSSSSSQASRPEADFRALSDECAQVKQSLAHQTGQVALLQQRSTIKDDLVNNLRQQVAAKDREIATVKADRDADLHEADKVATAMDDQVTQLQGQVAALTTNLADRSNALAASNNALAARSNDLAARDSTIAGLQTRVTGLEADLAAAHDGMEVDEAGPSTASCGCGKLVVELRAEVERLQGIVNLNTELCKSHMNKAEVESKWMRKAAVFADWVKCEDVERNYTLTSEMSKKWVMRFVHEQALNQKDAELEALHKKYGLDQAKMVKKPTGFRLLAEIERDYILKTEHERILGETCAAHNGLIARMNAKKVGPFDAVPK
ncbi:hypothetical protein K490DRAFT_52815 [Saccharata proteae CBS 121410]|uniref:Uncharacterized protein n=1 Tax=Saccharata proteae CBS 121410 TaxID=1314787 RepID=A0A9P4I177_9PEZI|nr:hypothetical protein K490DRAFT_52815 [Saccharata proteae CBS 121410]